MLTRCVVNVSTGRYRRGGERLRAEMAKLGNCDVMCWKDPLPEDWPSHESNPYAFKSFSLVEAAKQYDLLLWCDAAVIPIKQLDPLWERIERDGYWFAINGWTNYEWTADSAYKDLFPELPIEEARKENKKFTQVVATTFGLNVRSAIGEKFLEEYHRLAQTDAFKGPWSNTRNPACWKQDQSRMGDCGPSDVLGHRHDQTAASVLAWRMGMKLTQCPSIFAFPPAADDTLLLSVGA